MNAAQPSGGGFDWASLCCRYSESKNQMSASHDEPEANAHSYYPVLEHIAIRWIQGCKCRVCRSVDDGVLHVRKDFLKDPRPLAAEGRRRTTPLPGS